MASAITFQIIKDLAEAKKYWELFSPGSTIYGAWDFRYCFYKYYNFPLFFYVGFADNEPIGLLPLQYNTEKNYLEFFGGNYMEDNQIYIKPEFFFAIPQFYQQVTTPHQLEYIIGQDVFTKNLPVKEYKYTLPLEGLKSYEDFLEKFVETGFRKKLREKMRQVERANITIAEGSMEDMELLFDLNISSHSDSSFTWPYRKEIFRDLLRLSYPVHLSTFMVNGEKQAVSFALGYKNIFESFNSGVNRNGVKNLTTFVQMHKINTAIKGGYAIFDAFTCSFDWKDKWGLLPSPQYKIER